MAKQQKNPLPAPPPPHEPSYTVDEFCRAEGIKPATYYRLKSRGRGPREMRYGGTIRISHRARLDWQRERENPKGAELKEVRTKEAKFKERGQRARAVMEAAR